MQVLVHNPSCVQKYSHIILDEIHERSIEADVVLVIVRELLKIYSFKLIIMSATVNCDNFTSYFRTFLNNEDVACPYLITRQSTIVTYFLNDLEPLTRPCTSTTEWQREACSNLKELIGKVKPENKTATVTPPVITVQMQAISTELIISQSRIGEQVLVFLPGVAEIVDYYDSLMKQLISRNLSEIFTVSVLHSQMCFEEMDEVFKSPPSDLVKVILSTNIAESSLTFPHLRLVVNFGLYRLLEYDSKRRISKLTTKWCSRTSCIQRAGRTGRVSEGVAIHLCTKKFYNVEMEEYNLSEVQLVPIAKVILQAKNVGPKIGIMLPSEFLLRMIDLPPHQRFVDGLKDLADLGAIVSKHGFPVLEQSELTLVGQFALSLPVEIELCRMILYAILFGIPCDGIIMAATASLHQDLFTLPSQLFSSMSKCETYGENLKNSMNSRFHFDGGLFSEPVMTCNMFKQWLQCKYHFYVSGNQLPKGIHTYPLMRSFCNRHCVQWQRLLQLEHTVSAVASRVLHLIPHCHPFYADVRSLSLLVHSPPKPLPPSNPDMLNALLAACFPQKFIVGCRHVENTDSRVRNWAHEVVYTMKSLGYNPRETVTFSGTDQVTVRDIEFLVSTVLPHRFSTAHRVKDIWYLSLYPTPGSIPAIPSNTLSEDMCLFWQYGERTGTWKVPGCKEYFTQPQNPFLFKWVRVSQRKEKVIINSWRNPPALFCCDFTQVCPPYLGIATSIQGVRDSIAVAVSGITVLGRDKALALLLAFQPQGVNITFLTKEGAISQVKLYGHTFCPPYFTISAKDFLIINEIRKVMSCILKSSALQLKETLRVQDLLHGLIKGVSPETLNIPPPPVEPSPQFDGDSDSEFEFDAISSEAPADIGSFNFYPRLYAVNIKYT